MAVQWLKLCASNAGNMGSVPAQVTKMPHAAWRCTPPPTQEKVNLKLINLKNKIIKLE